MHACQRWSCAPSSCLQVPLISSWKILTKRVLFLLCVVMAAEGNCGHPLACRPLGERILLICSSRFFRQWLWPDGAAHHAWPSDTRSLPGKCSADGCLLFRSVCVCEWERESNEEKLPTIFNQTKAERFIPSTDVFGLFWCWCADLMWTSRMYVLTDEPQQFTTTPTLPIPSTFNQL